MLSFLILCLYEIGNNTKLEEKSYDVISILHLIIFVNLLMILFTKE